MALAESSVAPFLVLSFFADLFQFSNIRISFRQSDTLLDVDSTFDVVAGIDSVVDENAITTLAATKTIQVTATSSKTATPTTSAATNKKNGKGV